MTKQPESAASVKSSMDPKSIQLRVGLEVHQQLATETKLFCGCPPFSGESGADADELTDSSTYEFRRILRPATSELGELDIAARFESRREIKVRYLVNMDTSCLVEADEEPPHPISEEAVDTALLFSLSLNSRVADEVHVMRKIVVDGSNTSGFQRTAVIALGGKLIFGGGKSSVEVQSISLEEDAARAVNVVQPSKRKTGITDEQEEDERTYALDRLGTPLVEVALAPIESTPEEVEDAAKTLGRFMRSTGRIARGLGTIRQDLNVSVMNGNVIEVKGVQRLDQISKAVLFEASRQKFFFDLAKEIREKIGNELDISSHDVTALFRKTKSQVIKKGLSGGTSKESVILLCLVVSQFAGYFGKENEFQSRLGKELGSIANTYGLGGVFHSDELPNYGITQEEVSIVRRELQLKLSDGFVLIAGPSARVTRAAEALSQRIRYTTKGVPAETRAASLKGETVFLRPRPGSARMYPETDIPLIPITSERLDALRDQIPEPWDVQVTKFGGRFVLPKQLAEPLFDSEYRGLFEKIVSSTKLAPSFVASVFVDRFQSLARDGTDIYSLSPSSILSVFKALSDGKFAKEAISEVLKSLVKDPTLKVEQALAKAGIERAMTKGEVRDIVDQIIQENLKLIASKGREGAQGTLMGRVMQTVRGRADGKLVSEVLSERLATAAASFDKEEKVNQ